MNANNLPALPTVAGIGFNELFGDAERANRWYGQKQKRAAFICDLIKKCVAAQFSDPNNEARFYIASPGIRDKRFSLSEFNEYGAVGDWQRDDPKDFVREIPDDFILTDIMY